MKTYKFTREHTNGRKFTDAILLPDDHNLTDEEIERMQDQRFERWLSVIDPAALLASLNDVPTDESPI